MDEKNSEKSENEGNYEGSLTNGLQEGEFSKNDELELEGDAADEETLKSDYPRSVKLGNEDQNVNQDEVESQVAGAAENSNRTMSMKESQSPYDELDGEDDEYSTVSNSEEEFRPILKDESVQKLGASDKPDVPLDDEYPSEYPDSLRPSKEELFLGEFIMPDEALSDDIDRMFQGQLSPSETKLERRMSSTKQDSPAEESPPSVKTRTHPTTPSPESVQKIIKSTKIVKTVTIVETIKDVARAETKPEYPAIPDEPLRGSRTSLVGFEQLTLPGPSSFLDFEQPPDEMDIYTHQDSIDTNIEISCPITGNVFEGDDEGTAPNKNALSLAKCYGQEGKVPVLNLSQGDHLAIVYACSHTGVVYDAENRQQYLLQGHSNSISCLTTSYDKNWVVVADKGKDSVMNVWHVSVHTKVMTPVRTFFNFQTAGVAAVAMSQSGNIIAVLTADFHQNMSIWNWTDPNESPIVSANLDRAHGYQNYLLFNPDDQSQLVSNGDTCVIFYAWTESRIKLYAPHITHFDLMKQVGRFSATVFIKNSSNALTATSLGKFLVWEKFRPVALENLTPHKRVHKIVRMQNKGISVLTMASNFIVTGDVLGHIKFYDETLKLVNWFKDVNLGPITSISFDFDPEVKSEGMLRYGKETEFEIQNFIFGTANAKFVYVTANGTKYEIVNEDFECQVIAMDVHPAKPLIALGGQNGLVRIFQYQTGNAVASKVFDGGKVPVSCLAYNIDGSMIAVGFSNGKVEILHGLNLHPFGKSSLMDTTKSITHISFSGNLDFMATADKGFAVTVYRILKEKVWIDDGLNFIFFGRFRAHNKPIRSITFKCKSKVNTVEFFSLGLDRCLVEYNLYSPGGGLSVKNRIRLEQFAVPLCMGPYPKFTKEPLLLVCNDQFKFKLFNITSGVCRKTLLGPMYGIPVQKFLISSCKGKGSSKTHFIAYMLADKIGISLLPITGNPHQSFTMISHPMGVQNIAISYDGKYLFSIGGKSASLLMWSVNLVALEVQVDLGGSNLAPFYAQIEGGKDGQFMYELQNLFYFAQIQNQGLSTAEERRVGVTIPLSEISSIMRVLGYFPTEQKITDMINEIRYEKYMETGEVIEDIDVESFLRLYVNHKPVKCEQNDKLNWAFEILGSLDEKGQKKIIERDLFLKYLTEHGEPLSYHELASCMAALSGITIEASVCYPTVEKFAIENILSEKLTADEFSKFLGFDKV